MEKYKVNSQELEKLIDKAINEIFFSEKFVVYPDLGLPIEDYIKK